MSANFHTPYTDPMALDTPTLESPLAELDQAITDLLAGDDAITQLNLGAFNAKTISSGAITGNVSLITVDTESSAATDDLDNINSGSAGDVIIIKTANDSRDVTIRHLGGGSGNIRTYNALNIRMDSTNQMVMLVNNGTNWVALPLFNSFITTPITTGVTISSGSVVYQSSYMAIDTESSASSDDLDTISGGVQGSWLIIKTVNASRDVVVKHNTGNIYISNETDITLDHTEKVLFLVYNSGSAKWHTQQLPINYKQTQSNVTVNTPSNAFGVPYQSIVTSGHPLASATQPFMDIAPLGGIRQPRILSAADTTLEGYGFGTLTVSGTPSNNYGVGSGTAIPGSMVRWASGGSSGNLGGVVSPFTLTSVDAYPTFRIIFRTYNNISVCRFWIGLSSAAIGNTDSPSSAGTDFIGIRYSTVVPDSFWQFVTSNGTTTTASSTTVGISADNTYELLIACANTSATLYFRNIANSTYVSLTTTTTLPSATQSLGLNARVETREAVTKSLQIYGVALTH